MKSDAPSRALSTLAALVGLAVLCAAGCGSTTKNAVRAVPEGSAGEAGAAGDGSQASGGSAGAAGDGSQASGGSAGSTPNASDAGSAGEAGVGDLGGGPTNSGGDAGASGATGQPPLYMEPDIDAGSGCIEPSPEPPITAASAGLPKTGMALWLRADRGVYMTAAHRVCAWADQSGHEEVLLSNADDNRPLWQAASVGGQASVHFDAPNRGMVVGNVLGIPAQSARTLIAVTQLVNTSDRAGLLQQGQPGSYGTFISFDANTFHTVGNREGVYLMNNAYDAALATSTTTRIHILTIGPMTLGTPILDAIDYRINGVSQALTRTEGGLGNGNFEDFSGANYTAVGSGPDAYEAEAIYYDRALSTAERDSVETALAARYGVQ